MSDTLLTHQQEEILALLTRNPDGLNSEGIRSGLKNPPHLRTVQRSLAELVTGRHIAAVGKGKATIYKLLTSSGVPAASTGSDAPGAEEGYESYIPLSEKGREIFSHVRRPRGARAPVGYEREFLDSYLPNETWYLGEMTRNHLHRIGDTGDLERPAGTYGRAMLNRLLIDLTWASCRLEGNTYSRLDTQNLIEFGRYPEGKDAQDAQMVLNHKAAIELLVDDAATIGFDAHTFLSLHGLLSENLMPDPDASGRLRSHPVQIGGTVFVPLAVPQTIEECFYEILRKAGDIRDPFEQAFFIMVHIPYLQPFEDVNKRVSRLGANIPLIKHNLSPLTFIDVPERAYIDAMLGVYELNRVELLRDLFVWAYERSAKEYVVIRKSLAQPEPLRLRYRRQLHELVADIVREKEPDFLPAVERYAEENIGGGDRAAFVEMVQDEIKRLHPGIIARYRLRPSEFAAWQEARKLN
ncbi:MAG: cell filamentation protein Fic [Geobacteraceae bacterium GWC2_58_44]|nr:MAG: cell filamentation protein Fic [Geobacteraceae bacterium GWC2_58_44]HBG04516.1 cell filamentation protein Fic [Geobacter sp.]